MSTPAPTHNMKYRFLGDTGLMVSTFSFGTMMFGPQVDVETAYSIMKTAYEGGVNFFDSAEMYMGGKAEEIMGAAIKIGIERGTWSREDLVVSAKIYFGTPAGPNSTGLSRKHVIEGTKASLKRAGLDYVDLIFCHRPDAHTPIEETVRAMNFVIDQGWAFYWGTSEWSSVDIIEACEVADRLGLVRPVMEQPRYSLFYRERVEYDYLNLYTKYKFGLTTFSPLASGILTGKYSKGIPEGSRLSVDFYMRMMKDSFEERVAKADELAVIAKKLDCSLAQLALAWCASNPNVSTVMVGATTVAQLEENLKAIDVVEKITSEIKDEMNAIVGFVPKILPRHEPFITGMRAKYL